MFYKLLIPSSYSQNSFEVRLDSEMDEVPIDFIMNSDNEYVGIIWKANTVDYLPNSHIYKVSNEGDTISKPYFKQDTVLKLYKIIQSEKDPPEYIVIGTGYHKDSSASLWFSYFAQIDQNFDIVWEKTYQLHNVDEYVCTPIYPQILKLKEGGFLHACYLEPHWKMYLFNISATGDSLDYRLYENDSSGQINDLTYNYDSTAFWLHTHFAHYTPTGPESQCVEVDFDLRQTKVMYYPRWFSTIITAKLLPDRSLVAGSQFSPPGTSSIDYMLAAFKLDSNFNVLKECIITHPDTLVITGLKSLDFYAPSIIYLGGTHNYQIGIWVPGPSWFVVARMNESLEVEDEKYIGGDTYYTLATLTATSDSGVLISGTIYDYESQSYERDAVILKLNWDDFTTVLNESKGLIISSAIVYPNPGSSKLFVRTTLKNAYFRLYNSNGKLVHHQNLNNQITRIKTTALSPGIYSWIVLSEKKLCGSGKWIKSQ